MGRRRSEEEEEEGESWMREERVREVVVDWRRRVKPVGVAAEAIEERRVCVLE